MWSRNGSKLAVSMAIACFAGSAYAAVSAEEAKQLGATLTPWGAEKAGNKDGSIPAYTGEGIKAPANYDLKDPGRRPDPYAGEKPLFTITAQNYQQHADKLDGMVELFKKYPNYRMDIYPSHRSVIFPKWVNDNTFKNATSCKGTDGDLKLEGCHGGVVFPIPKSGAQVMWNHLTAFEAEVWGVQTEAFLVAVNGNVTQTTGTKVAEQSDFYDSSRSTPATPNTIYWVARLDTYAPSRSAGEKLVLADALDNLSVGRRAYQYIPGQRRVKLAPDLNYDTPSPTAGGGMTMDDGKTFLGPLDRFDWKLVGKKEKYIMYNNFKLTDHGACTQQVILTKNFPNPDCVRWELHRVWVVEAKLKPNVRHIYARRVAYWDEDGYGAGMVENYDAGGKMYRMNFSVHIPFWSSEGGGQASDFNIALDLQTGGYVYNGLTANPGTGVWVEKQRRPATYFSPEALAGEGIR